MAFKGEKLMIAASTTEPTKMFAPKSEPIARSTFVLCAFEAMMTVMMSLAPFARASSVAPAMASEILSFLLSRAMALEMCSSQMKPIKLKITKTNTTCSAGPTMRGMVTKEVSLSQQ